ncbi:MAG: hypothetical protein B9S32_09380 [Verrucomicrobia bacterium Tous-C9LFEB]|nr:MAG: hypothetical protein B9S32_09380 [Verrucomicrobia bacterium Tous-C9LFEB]
MTLKALLRHFLLYLICYAIVFAILIKSVIWSFPIPGGDSYRTGMDLRLAQLGMFIADLAEAPFIRLLSGFENVFWFIVTGFWAAVVYLVIIALGRVCLMLYSKKHI